MRNVQSAFNGRPAQARRLSLAQFRSDIARWHREHGQDGSARDRDLDGFAHLWEGYLAHGRRQLAGVDCGRVILAPELGGGYGVADLVVGRCLIEVKTAFDPAAAMGDWLNQVLAYALLDWSDALGVDTVAVYLGWQALLIAESLARVLAAATPGPTPSLNALRADFRTAMQADIDESFAVRMRQRYPPFVTPARNQAASLEVRCGLSVRPSAAVQICGGSAADGCGTPSHLRIHGPLIADAKKTGAVKQRGQKAVGHSTGT